MIVVAIIGILAAVALPAYQDYTKKAKMAEVVLAASACRTTVTEIVQSATSLPASGAWGCESTSATSKYVGAVSVSTTGKITVTVAASSFGDATIDGKLLTLTPFSDSAATTAPTAGGTISVWRCGNTTDGTTIPTKFLPGSCKG
jgi:type IV pilus assembly protein PilA